MEFSGIILPGLLHSYENSSSKCLESAKEKETGPEKINLGELIPVISGVAGLEISVSELNFVVQKQPINISIFLGTVGGQICSRVAFFFLLGENRNT